MSYIHTYIPSLPMKMCLINSKKYILECLQLDLCPGSQSHSSTAGICTNLKRQFGNQGFNNICEKPYIVSIHIPVRVGGGRCGGFG